MQETFQCTNMCTCAGQDSKGSNLKKIDVKVHYISL